MTAAPPSTPPLEPISGEPAEYLFSAQDNRGLPGQFHYWRGRNGHVFLDPIPSDLDRFYADGYQPIPADEAELAEAAKADAYRLEPLLGLKPSGTFLEIGSWIGLTAYCAKQAGYRVSVLEREGRCVDLMQRAGIDAIQTGDPARSLADLGRSFDVIGLWHSIEHLPRPWEVLQQAARALNPGGVLLVAAPNPESAQARVLGKHWYHLDAPRHIHFMPMDLIEQMAGREGLKLVSKTTDDPLGADLDRHGWELEMRRRARNIKFLRGAMTLLFARRFAARHRQPGAIDGAAFTMIFQRPA